MEAVFKVEEIAVFDDDVSWREAVMLCGELLYKTGAAQKEYAIDMVKAVEEMGPYIVVVPHIALAHAEPGSGVLRDGICLCVFRKPVKFGSENDPVHIVIGLCARSKESHLAQFEPLADILDSPEIYEGIISRNTPQMIFEYLMGL